MRTKFMSYATFTGNEVGEIMLETDSKDVPSNKLGHYCIGRIRHTDYAPATDGLEGVVLTTYLKGVKTNPKFIFRDNLMEKDASGNTQHKKVGQVLPNGKKVTFAGVVASENYGQVDLIRLDDGYLYGTKKDFDGYQKIGPAVNYIPEEVITILPEDNYSYSHVALTKGGKYYNANISIGEVVPGEWVNLRITIGMDRKMRFIDLCKPVYLQASWNQPLDGNTNDSHSLKIRFFDKYGVCIETDYTEQGFRMFEAPQEALSSVEQNLLGNASHREYGLRKNGIQNTKKTVDIAKYEFHEGRLLTTFYEYDQYLRVNSIVSDSIEFGEGKFHVSLSKKTIQYLGDSISLIAMETVSRKDTQDQLHIVKCEKHRYENGSIEVDNISGKFTMTVHTETRYADPIKVNPVLEDKDFRVKKDVKIANYAFHPLVMEGTSTSNSLKGMIVRNVYSNHQFCKQIATFYNCISDIDLIGSDFLSFEQYEDFKYKMDQYIVENEYLKFTKVSLSNNAFLGQRCLQCENETTLEFSKDFKIVSDKNYIISYWYKNNAKPRTWIYKEVGVKGADIVVTRKISNLFEEKTFIDCFAVYEENTQFTVNIYSPTHGILIATLSENHIPTLYFYDELNRNVLTCVLKVVSSQSGDFQCDFRTIKLEPVRYTGYSRFGGYNCAFSSGRESNDFNTIMEVVPCEESVLFSSVTKKQLEVNNKDGIYICGPIISKNQEIQIEAVPYYININFDNDVANVFLDGKFLSSSQQYIYRRSAWAIIAVQNMLIIMANGKIVLSTILEKSIEMVLRVKVDPVNLNSTIYNEENAVYVTKKFNVSMQYYDFKENLIQQQILKSGIEKDTLNRVRVITQQNFYNSSGGNVIKTLSAPYPVKAESPWKSTDRPLLYRDKFAICDYQDAFNVVIKGEVLDYYLDEGAVHFSYIDETKKDSQWPFESYQYESNLSGRLLKYYPSGHHRLIMSKDYNYFWADQNRTFESSFNFKNEYTVDRYQYSNKSTSSTTFSGNFSIKTDILGSVSERFSVETKGTYLDQSEESYRFQQQVQTQSSGSLAISKRSYMGGEKGELFVLDLDTTIFNRVMIQGGVVYPHKYRINDNLGFTKLVSSNSDPTSMKDLKYAEYDIFGRIVEAGSLVYTKGSLDVVTAANIVNTIQSGIRSFSDVGFTVTPIYKYYYDYQDNTYGDKSIFQIGRLIKVQDLVNNSQMYYTYDYLGRKIKEVYVDQEGSQEMKFSYNIAGKVLSERFQGLIIRTNTDIFGDTRRKSVVHETNTIPVVDGIKYDIDHHVSEYQGTSGEAITRTYDVFGNELSLGMGTFQISNNYCSKTRKPFTVNLLQEKTYQDLGLNRKEEFDYNIMSFVKESTDWEGNKTSYKYNQIGSLTGLTDKDGSKTFDYNFDQLLGYKDDKGTVHKIMDYDGLGRSTSSKCNPACQFDFKYSDFFENRLKEITRTELAASEKKTSYHVDEIVYDNLGRIKNLKISGQGTDTYKKETKYFYGAYGNILRTVTNLNGEVQELTYLYVENILVGLYDSTNQKVINTLYDQENVLRSLSYENEAKELYKKNLFYKNVWGEFDESFDQLDQYIKDHVSFFYGSCMYINELGINLLNGAPYIEYYGLLGTPRVNAKYFSHYRLKGNKPL